MKKRLSKLIIGVAVMFVLSITSSVFADSMVVVNCNEWVSLRTYPSTSAETLTQIPLGAQVESIGWSDGFNQVVYNGLVGGVLSSYLGYNDHYCDNSDWGKDYMFVVNCQEWVSLRSAPSISAYAITTVPLGARVESIGWENGFNQVVYNGMTGWILTSYLSYFRY